jgi:eukaryotic-like serine/threonine-protein kinase
VNIDELDVDEVIRESLRDFEPDYHFTECQTKGANGHVFFAVNTITKQRIAVKYYYCGDEARFHAEPQALANVDCPHVIPVTEARVLDDEWAFFVSPFREEGDLESLLATQSVSLHRAIDLAIGVLKGASTLQAAGLVHRDLKPANILLDGERRALIGDFGSVRRIPDGETTVPGSGHTPLYRPPESWEHEEYGRPGDIYQAGLILFELLGGELPAADEAWLDRQGQREYAAACDDFGRTQALYGSLARKAGRGQIPPVATLPETVDGSLRRIVTKATRVVPAERYPNPGTMIAKLSDARGAVLDWSWDGTVATAVVGSRTYRVTSLNGTVTARQDLGKGSGYRRVPGVGGSTVREVVEWLNGRS